MPRKATAPSTIDAPGAGLVAVHAEFQAAGADLNTVSSNAIALADQLGYDGALTFGALEDEIRFYQRRSVEAALELGKRLLLLKEMTPHGEFSQRVELLGINSRMAQRFMGATLKFAKSDTKSFLHAAGNQTKLLELVVLDDEEIAELAGGGSARGIDLDDIAAMTVTDLRKALREARENEQAMGRVLQEKNAKLDELATGKQKRHKVGFEFDEKVLGATDELSQLGTVADEVLGKHVAFIELCESIADQLDPDAKDHEARLEQVRVPINRLGEQIARFGHLVARMQFEFEQRLSMYQDNTHTLDPAEE